VGIGHASYFEALKSYGNYVGIDIDERSVAERGARAFPARASPRRHPRERGFLDAILPQKADGILSSRASWSTSRTTAARLANLADALKPGGRLMISVPALMGLYNDMDRLAGTTGATTAAASSASSARCR
jgi:SAM-dependent methyltransferase